MKCGLARTARMKRAEIPVTLDDLFDTLVERLRPESVAEMIGQVMGSKLPRGPLAQLKRITGRGQWRPFSSITLMPIGFRPVDRMDRQLAKAQELASVVLGETIEPPLGDDRIHAFVDRYNQLVGRMNGADFRYGRMNRAERAAAGIDLSRRRYNKVFRNAMRLEGRHQRFLAVTALRRLLLAGKAGLVADLDRQTLTASPLSLAFIAYYSAMLKRRSVFTAGPQARAFDYFCAALLTACKNDPAADWFAIAHVFPRDDVLERLSDEQKGILLGKWFGILRETALLLRDLWQAGDIDLDRMIVRPGNDSSTWNLLAQSWNRSRDSWMAVVQSLGADAILDDMLPGKVMRLMAADVAAWHRMNGGDIHPDTLVWRELPKPWDVIEGKEPCGRDLVASVCGRHKLDPEISGWTAARPKTAIQASRPTPELANGVVIGDPVMAAYLRRIGYFSGKGAPPQSWPTGQSGRRH